MKIDWVHSPRASALHAARVLVLGLTPMDRHLPTIVGPVIGQLDSLLREMRPGSPRNPWEDLISWSVQASSATDLVTSFATRGGLSAKDPGWSLLAAKIAEWERLFRELYPKLAEQLPLRSKPLQELWEGYGGGLLAHVGRLTERELLVDRADVVVVHPVLGGFGVAHLHDNRVRWEAVLTNVIPELPEIVRLAWTLSQLHLDLPMHSEAIAQSRLDAVAAIAMVPPVLAAGQIVELNRIDEATVALAIDQWQIPIPRSMETSWELSQTILSWWETYLQTRPPWRVAMMALDRMLLSENVH
jgi:hypothetical protein